MARIDLIDVGKTFKEGARPFSIQKLNLRIPDGKTMVILGPSGCGKTTLLRIIAGLIPPDSGEVRYDGVEVKDVPPGGRRIGMVFQNYALYPHFTSRTNILSYFLFRKKTPELDALAKAKYQRTSELMGVELRICWTASRPRCPVAKNSEWLSAAASPETRPSSWWTSPSPTWIKRCVRSTA